MYNVYRSAFKGIQNHKPEIWELVKQDGRKFSEWITYVIDQGVKRPYQNSTEVKIVTYENIDIHVNTQTREVLRVLPKSKQTVTFEEKMLFVNTTVAIDRETALQRIMRWTETIPDKVYKVTYGHQKFTVHFITPKIAQKYAQELQSLSMAVGYPIVYHEHPNPGEINNFIRAIMPAKMPVKKNVSVHAAEEVIVLGVTTLKYNHPQMVEIKKLVESKTGYGFALRHTQKKKQMLFFDKKHKEAMGK